MLDESLNEVNEALKLNPNYSLALNLKGNNKKYILLGELLIKKGDLK